MAMELKIVLDDAGNITINGPIDNKIMCYGLLDVAKEVIAAHHEQQRRLVQPATTLAPDLRRRSS